jgi:hypothetical protein
VPLPCSVTDAGSRSAPRGSAHPPARRLGAGTMVGRCRFNSAADTRRPLYLLSVVLDPYTVAGQHELRSGVRLQPSQQFLLCFGWFGIGVHGAGLSALLIKTCAKGTKNVSGKAAPLRNDPCRRTAGRAARPAHRPMLVVDQRQQLHGGVRVALLDGGQDARDLVHGRRTRGGWDSLRRSIPPGAAHPRARWPIHQRLAAEGDPEARGPPGRASGSPCLSAA